MLIKVKGLFKSALNLSSYFKPLANRRNIVGQQLPTLLDVTCCVRLHTRPCCMLLDVVACYCAKFETGQTFQPTTPNISFVPWSPKLRATMLDPFAQQFLGCLDNQIFLPLVPCCMHCTFGELHLISRDANLRRSTTWGISLFCFNPPPLPPFHVLCVVNHAWLCLRTWYRQSYISYRPSKFCFMIIMIK